MAAFQFPDPAVQTTVTNPITGSTYQWKEPPGKWVVTVKVREVGDIVWEGDNPPDPIGDYKLWYSTDTLELYFYYCDVNGTCAWLPTSTAITQFDLLQGQIDEIKDNVGEGTLQETLENGNVADKGILLTDAEDALIALAPDEATIDIASDTEKKNPRLRLTHIDELNFPNAQAQIELDQNGTRVDFEFYQDIDECHFRFDNEEKFILNREGDAEFTGRVKVSPGIDGTEVATVNQLKILQDEIEQLRPTLARGLWQYQKIWPAYLEGNPSTVGLYSLMGGELSVRDQKDRCDAELLQCQIDAAGDPIAGQQCNLNHQACYEQAEANGSTPNWIETWEEVTNIFIAGTDLNGVKHFFTDDEIKGKYVEFFNTDDDGYGLFKVLNYGGLLGGDLQFVVELVQAKGTPNGTASFQIFDLDDDLTDELGNFVRKSGDTMTGALLVEADATSKFTGQTSALACYGGPGASDGTYVFYVYGAPYPKPDGDEGETQKDLLFGCVNDGRLFGKSGQLPTSSSQLTNKLYVDNQDNKIKTEVKSELSNSFVQGDGLEIYKSGGVYYIKG